MSRVDAAVVLVCSAVILLLAWWGEVRANRHADRAERAAAQVRQLLREVRAEVDKFFRGRGAS